MIQNSNASSSLSQYLTIKQVAELLSMNEKTVRRRIADGTFIAYGTKPREYRLKVEDIEEAMSKYATNNWR